MNATAIQCPNCGASLYAAECEDCFCSYCGTYIATENEKEYVIRHVDEAQIKRVEMEREVRFRELELEEQRMKQENTLRLCRRIKKWAPYLVWVGASGIAFLIASPLGVLFLLVGTVILFVMKPKRRKSREAKAAGKIRLNRELMQIANKRYQTMESEFRAAGFRDVRSVNMGDLVLGLRNKPGSVVRVSINGRTDLKRGKWYDPNEIVIISYHGFPGR